MKPEIYDLKTDILKVKDEIEKLNDDLKKIEFYSSDISTNMGTNITERILKFSENVDRIISNFVKSK